MVQVNGKTEWVKLVIFQGRRVEKKSEIGDRSLRFEKDKNREQLKKVLLCNVLRVVKLMSCAAIAQFHKP